jgi:hypothetical protein
MDASEIVRRLIDDLEHAESVGQVVVAIDTVLSPLRAIRDQIGPELPL